jgi:hypothetical protein
MSVTHLVLGADAMKLHSKWSRVPVGKIPDGLARQRLRWGITHKPVRRIRRAPLWYPPRLSAYRISFQTRRLLSTKSGSICKTTSYRWQIKVDNLVLSCTQDSEPRCLAVVSTDGDPHTPSHHPVRHRDSLAKHVAALRKQSRFFVAWASSCLRYTTWAAAGLVDTTLH